MPLFCRFATSRSHKSFPHLGIRNGPLWKEKKNEMDKGGEEEVSDGEHGTSSLSVNGSQLCPTKIAAYERPRNVFDRLIAVMVGHATEQIFQPRRLRCSRDALNVSSRSMSLRNTTLWLGGCNEARCHYILLPLYDIYKFLKMVRVHRTRNFHWFFLKFSIFQI